MIKNILAVLGLMTVLALGKVAVGELEIEDKLRELHNRFEISVDDVWNK